MTTHPRAPTAEEIRAFDEAEGRKLAAKLAEISGDEHPAAPSEDAAERADLLARAEALAWALAPPVPGPFIRPLGVFVTAPAKRDESGNSKETETPR